jgi:adenylate kinase
MRVALTGTPGTGKSSVATLLQKQGYTIVRLHQLAKENKCIDGIDTKRNTQLIDVNKLNNSIKKHFNKDTLVFFEGHIGHLLNAIDKVIILRCHPKDVILCEAIEHHSKENVFEIDTTKKSIEEVVTIIIDIVKKKFRPTKPYTIGQIDWSEEILKENLA